MLFHTSLPLYIISFLTIKPLITVVNLMNSNSFFKTWLRVSDCPQIDQIIVLFCHCPCTYVYSSLCRKEKLLLFVISSSLELFVDRNRVLLHSVSHICITGPDTLKMLGICWIHNFIIRQILNTKILCQLSFIDHECCANSQREKKGEGNYVKPKITEEVSFLLFPEYVKNLNRLKGKHSVFKAKGTRY